MFILTINLYCIVKSSKLTATPGRAGTLLNIFDHPSLEK